MENLGIAQAIFEKTPTPLSWIGWDYFYWRRVKRLGYNDCRHCSQKYYEEIHPLSHLSVHISQNINSLALHCFIQSDKSNYKTFAFIDWGGDGFGFIDSKICTKTWYPSESSTSTEFFESLIDENQL